MVISISCTIYYQTQRKEWGLYINYRKVNNITEKDSYSVLYINEIFDSLGGTKIFTIFGFYQILMNEENFEMTTLTT